MMRWNKDTDGTESQSELKTNPYPAGTQRWLNIDSTLIQRHDVESTLNEYWVNVVCLLGS